ncbi:hypothetical protein [Fructobacillus cardui]|uniref:hypothetical protein n=1 Tax=Fructobacillus cardui TaxID=2893170 RepID=UPI00200B6E10|nr:hypothetical protein [Fructobacillus cardui]MCK8627197.1 hypothetical protein [Fructobacillus cardui]
MKNFDNLLTPILRGYSKLNFAGNMYVNNVSVNLGSPKDDAKAIKSDWEVVGKTIHGAMKDFDYEH